MRHCILATVVGIAVAISAPALAQGPAGEQSIRVGEPLPGWAKVRPGTRTYLRYRVKGERRTAMDIWTRRIAFEPDAAGVQRLHIVQRWTGATLPFDREVDSWFELRTFRPLSHASRRIAGGKTIVAAVHFLPGRVAGDKAISENSQAGLDVATPVPTYNFETDMELLSALPWRDGYSAQINFYHPGGDPPAWYRYKVEGSQLVAVGDRELDSWVVAIDYGKAGSARFWIDKQSHVVLRVATVGPDIDGVLYKILLPDEPG